MSYFRQKSSLPGDVTATLSAAHLLSGILFSNPAAAITLTLPSAAVMVAGDSKAQTGAGLFFFLRNDGAFIITVAAGSTSQWYLYYTATASGSQAYQVTRVG